MGKFKKTILGTLVVVCVAGTAIIGAISGSLTTLFITNGGVSLFLNPSAKQNGQALMESRIVELIEEESATISVVEKVTPAVVSIIVKKERKDLNQPNGFSTSPFFFVEPTEEGQSSEMIDVVSGTGFFVTQDGFVLTNRHVVDEEDATFVIVTNDGQELPATFIDEDPFLDVAILDVEGEGFPIVDLGDSDSIRIGQTVIAIGNTLSEFRNTVTKGVVSGINRRVTAGDSFSAETIEKAIQTDAAINPGNSGGPLINLFGEVIGINTAMSLGGESVAFAIPINEAKLAVQDVREFGHIVRPWVGVRYVLVSGRQDNGESKFEIGAKIVDGDQPGQNGIFPGSPAQIAGLKINDIIIAVDNIFISEDSGLSELLSSYRPLDTVVFSVLRNNEQIDLNVTLAEYDEGE